MAYSSWQIHSWLVEQLLCVPMKNDIYLDTFAFFYFFLIGLIASLKAAHETDSRKKSHMAVESGQEYTSAPLSLIII